MVVIGAALSSGFKSAFGQAADKLKTVGSAVAELGDKAQKLDALRNSQAKLGQGLETLAARQVKAGAASGQAAARVADLKTKIASGGDATGKFALRLDAAEQAAARAKNRFAMVDGELTKMRGEYQTVTAEATRFAAANGNVGSSLQRLDALTARSNAARDAMSANLAKRAKYQSSMLGVVAMGAGIGALVKHAADTEESRFPFRLSLELKGVSAKDIEKSIGQAKEFARKNPATVTQILDVELALNQRGMGASLARQVSGFVADLASLTGEESKTAGETVGSLFDSLGARMTGTALEKVRHIADVLGTMHFQGLDLDAESMKTLTQAAVRMRVPFETAVAAMGQLRMAGFDAGSAAQSTTMLLNRLDKASAKYGFGIARDAAGNLDLARTLRELKGSLISLPGGTQAAADAMVAMAGNRGVAALTALLARTDGLREAQKKLRDGAGFIDEATRKKMEEAGVQLEQIQKNLASIGATIGGVLLPGFNAILKPLAPIGAALSRFTEHHKILAKAMGTVIAAGLTLSAGLFAIGYASTFIKVPILMLRSWLADVERRSFLAALGLRSVAAAEHSAVSASAVAGVRSMFGAGAAESVAAGEAASALYGGGVAAGASKVAGRGLFGRIFGGMLGRGAMVAGGAVVGEVAAGAGTVGAGAGVGAGVSGGAGVAAGTAAGGLAVGPVLVIGAALVALAATVLLTWKAIQPIGVFLKGLWEGIKQGLAPIGEMIRATFAPIGEALAPLWGMLRGFFGWLVESTGMSSKDFKAALSSGIWWGQKLGTVLTAWFTLVFRSVGMVIESVVTLGKLLIDLATGNWGKLGDDIKAWGKYAVESAKAVGGAIANIAINPNYSGKAIIQTPVGAPVGAAIAAVATPPAGPDTLTHATQAGKKTRLGHLARMPHATSASQHALAHAHIPRMAMGGVLTQATHFIGGEAGAEAVIPLQRPSALLAIGAALANALAAAPTMAPARPVIPIVSPVRVALTQIEKARVPRPESSRVPATFNAPITIHATPGMNLQDIARAVRREMKEGLEDYERHGQARRRGGNHD
jgi:TP901 family phage tail tape measure protein